ncbi:MAG: RluA family pseudouridine synthase [Bacteroidota bacterium]|nr:RluA family pseudouridine synthase [Bacteroidota bacterium]
MADYIEREEIEDPDLESDEAENNNEEVDELYEHFRIVVDKGQGLLRIDKFLMARIENASRNKIQNAAKAGNILVNDKPAKSNYRIKPLDVISIVMPHPLREIEIIPQDIPLDIVYEDHDIIVINKKAGMVVHPGYGNYTGTLVNALAWRFNDKPEVQPYLVHRIDKDTSGIILVAKTELAQTRLAKEFFDHTIDRKYVALVWGDVVEDQGTITGHIGRSAKDRRQMTVYVDGSIGKHAVTHYKVIRRFGYITMIECVLETGRTHQIRAHMRFLGHPLFNDERYGGDQILRGTTFTKYKQFIKNCFEIMPRQALHAKSLGFKHPITKEYLFFDSELATDMQMVLDKWERYVANREIDPKG